MIRAWKKTLMMLFGGVFLLMGRAVAPSYAEDKFYGLTIEDHQFKPKELEIPAGIKVKLVIENLDKTAEEFESYELNREKIVPGGKKVTLFLGPLKPGSYRYFGEFHQKTAQGLIVVKE